MRRLLVISAVVVGGASAFAFGNYGYNFASRIWNSWFHSSLPQVAPIADQDILRQRQKEWVSQFSRDYGRIRGEVDKAKKEGLDTAFLEPKMAKAVGVARQGLYRESLVLLSLVEDQIPRKPEKVRPAEEQAPGTAKKKDLVSGFPVAGVKRHAQKRNRKKLKPQ